MKAISPFKSALAGLALCAALALPASSQTLPTYVSKVGNVGAATSSVWFASSPFQQIRVVSLIATSDLATAQCIIRGGDTPLTIAYSNTAASKQLGVSATNGFTVGDFVIVEKMDGTWTNGQIASFGAATNIVCTDNLLATVPGDQIYKMSSLGTFPFGVSFAIPGNYQGDALAVGGRGRPVWLQLNGTSACKIVSASARYE